jgi:DNA repair protein RadC
MPKQNNPNAGHRDRIRKKYLDHGLDVFKDYEVLELLLTFAISRGDVKPQAKKLIECFGSFRGVLDASDEELLAIKGIGESSLAHIRFIKDAGARYLVQASNLNSDRVDFKKLADYCRLQMGDLPDEEFHMFSLNSQFVLIKEDVLSKGTINQAAVYPRKVIELALKNKAALLVFCHNHPDGSLEPSEYDKTLTRALQLAAKTVSIDIYDHLIVSRRNCYSFREHQLL